MKAPSLEVDRFAQIRKARIDFGALTVLVGPPATGKSLLLQLLKYVLDGPEVLRVLRDAGFTWSSPKQLMEWFFGAGLGDVWAPDTVIRFGGELQHIQSDRKSRSDRGRVLFIPAQRTLALSDGWPKRIAEFKHDAPFVVRLFSQRLLEFLNTSDPAEPLLAERRFKGPLRKRILDEVFPGGVQPRIDQSSGRSELKLMLPGKQRLGFMSWTAGQREFVPLFLGVKYLLPGGPAKRSETWVIIEEPEMGLHPLAQVDAFLLLVELLARGYRVVVSTHSPTMLEILWAWKRLQAHEDGARILMKALNVSPRWDVSKAFQKVFRADLRTHYLYYVGEQVESTDISGLSAGAASTMEAFWGGLLALSSELNEAVAGAVRGE